MKSIVPAVRHASIMSVFRGLGVGEEEVATDRLAEQEVLLEHVGHLRAQGIHVDLADVVSVEENAAAGGLVETGDEIGEARLPGAGGADHGDHLADGEVEVDAVKGAVAVRIREIDVLEAHALLNGRQLRKALAGIFGFEIDIEEGPPGLRPHFPEG